VIAIFVDEAEKFKQTLEKFLSVIWSGSRQ
jgi:hypothetical protein